MSNTPGHVATGHGQRMKRALVWMDSNNAPDEHIDTIEEMIEQLKWWSALICALDDSTRCLLYSDADWKDRQRQIKQNRRLLGHLKKI